MGVELEMLTASALLTVVQAAPHLFAVMAIGGFRVAAGNRDDVPPLPEWANRAQRAYSNMLANLAPFTGLVLVSHLAGLDNDETASGATLFFWARLAYAVIYIAGIPYLRTVAFVASLFGMFDIASVILAAGRGTPPG